MRARFEKAFRSRTRDEWCKAFEGSDACFAPVLSFSEAREHPHAAARSAFTGVQGVPQPAPAPRFSRTTAEVRRAPPERGAGGESALRDWGFTQEDVNLLKSRGLGTKD